MSSVLRAGIAALLLAARLSAQAPSRSAYIDVLERYRAGDDSAAVAVASVDEKALQTVPDPLLTAAMVAHTEAAIALLEAGDYARSRRQMVRAQSCAEKLQSKNRADPMVRRWWPLAIGYMHGQRNYVDAGRMIARARSLGGDTPDLLLASGVTNESIVSAAQHGREFGAPQLGTLQEAERAYQAALAADSGLVEARLRLARVRTLRGDSASAARMLADIRTPGDPLFEYLARLFEGDALERQGAVDEARRRYEAAAALIPRAQSAQLALAYAGRSAGTRQDAAQRIRAVVAAEAPDGADPWFWYRSGFASRIEITLPELRKLVRQ